METLQAESRRKQVVINMAEKQSMETPLQAESRGKQVTTNMAEKQRMETKVEK
jgi:hypothetical protein